MPGRRRRARSRREPATRHREWSTDADAWSACDLLVTKRYMARLVGRVVVVDDLELVDGGPPLDEVHIEGGRNAVVAKDVVAIEPAGAEDARVAIDLVRLVLHLRGGDRCEG